MKQKLEKIFYICGERIDETRDKKYENYWLTPEKLADYAEIIQIGNFKEGFSTAELYASFSKNVNRVDDNFLNIILEAHGGKISDDEILLRTGKEEVLLFGKVVMEILRFASHGIPIKLIVTSCHGESVQNSLHELPKGSMLMTFGNTDTSVSSSDMYDSNPNKLLKIISSDGGFKFENLLILYCLKTDNDPVIGIHDKYGYLYKKRLSDFVHIKPDCNYDITKSLFNHMNIDPVYISNLLHSAMKWQLDVFKPYNNKDIVRLIIYSIANGTFVKDIETSYSLQSHNLYQGFYCINLKSKILEDMVEIVKELNKLDNIWENITSDRLHVLDKSLSKFYEVIHGNNGSGFEIIRNNLKFKLDGNILFQREYDEFLDKFAVELGLPIYVIEQKLKDLKSKEIIQLATPSYENDPSVDLWIEKLMLLEPFCQIIKANGIFDMDSPEVIKEYNILLSIAAENAIHDAREIINVYPSPFQIVPHTQLFGEQYLEQTEMN